MKFIKIDNNNNNDLNYDEMIKSGPAFIKIYSPNCGHCVRMQEAWDKLENNEDLKKEDINVIEILVDTTSNIESASGKADLGLPTIRYVNKNGKTWKEYEGNRETEDMVKFIKEHHNKNTKPNKSQKNQNGGGIYNNKKSKKTLKRKSKKTLKRKSKKTLKRKSKKTLKRKSNKTLKRKY